MVPGTTEVTTEPKSTAADTTQTTQPNTELTTDLSTTASDTTSQQTTQSTTQAVTTRPTTFVASTQETTESTTFFETTMSSPFLYTYSECVSCGLLNEHTFDGRLYDVATLETSSSYQLIAGDTIPFSAEVLSSLEEDSSDSQLSISVSSSSSVAVYLDRGETIINDILIYLPVQVEINDGSSLYVLTSGSQTIMFTDKRETLYYDQNGGWIAAVLPKNGASSYFNSSTVGLCGTFNDNELDEFTTPSGEIQSKQEFLNSWATSPLTRAPRQCSDVTTEFPQCDVISDSAEIQCPDNFEYRTCGPYCPPSCQEKLGMKPPLICGTDICSEGCFCKDGYVLNGDECTPDEECGCLFQGLYFKKNETIIPNSNCDVRCTCHGNNNYTCESIQCAENTATCTPARRTYECVCNPGYDGDGFTCISPCANGDPFICSDGSCIYATRRCDRTSDCPQGEDESKELCCDELNRNEYCPKSGYEVCQNGVYIPEAQFCDGWQGDCPENYDESEEICASRCTFEPSSEELLIDPVRATYKDGSNISFSCQMGYTLVGETYLVCYNQSWSGEEPICYEDCKKPNPPNKGAWNDTSDDFQHGEALSAVCKPGYEPVPDTAVTCYDGKVEKKKIKCKDIDECSSNPCQNGECVNKKDAFRCICDPGYEGTLCDEDINECLLPSNNDCDIDAICQNIPRGYSCECKPGFSGDGRSCTEDIFFPYGLSQGDDRLTRTAEMVDRKGNLYQDLVSPTIKPRTGFPMGDEFYYSLYIVDNGLIVFTKENERKFFYSYTYDRFTGSEDILCVAPFWSDAIINRNVGEVYYQEYQKSMSGTPPPTLAMLDDISGRINNESSLINKVFTATWALVVTWENVQALGTVTSNTFQAAIATDGTYSFALFNFQEGLMNWNYNALPYQNVIIGYNTGINYRNEHLTMKNEFRPDSETGNTGLQGRWIYRLEDNNDNVVNSKQLCLDWYEDEPDPSPWVDRFDPCPCSYFQAFRDRRLIWSYRAYSVKYYGIPIKWRGKLDQEFTDYLQNAVHTELCMQPTLPFPSWWLFDPNPKYWWWSWGNYKGNMCCYRWWDYSLIEGYYREVESSVAERYMFNLDYGQAPNNYYAWFDNDLMPRHHCCAKSNDEAFCDLYLEKRPEVPDCRGYRPPRWNPHFTTLDGYQYTFNGLGEYIMSRFVSPSDSTEEIFNLQGRTAKLLNSDGELTNATFFTAFAAQFVNSSKVEMVLSDDKENIEVYLNDVKFNTSLLSNASSYKDGGENGTFQLFKENMTSSQITGYWSSGFSISVELVSGMLEVVLSAPEDFSIGISAGLLGVWNGNQSDDLLRADGTHQPKADTEGNYTEREIFEFGETWRIPETGGSLFQYRDGTTWSDYNDVNFVPYLLDELISQTEVEDPEFYSNVTDTCGSSRVCTYDALASKNVDVGEGTKNSEENLASGSQSLENFPPNITGPSVIECVVGVEVVYQVYAIDPEGDEVVYRLEEPVPDGAKIDQNGRVTWTPTNVNENNPPALVIQARDAMNASSVLQPTIKLCACKNGTCNFQIYLFDANVVEDKFAVVACDCFDGYDGDFCEDMYDACQNTPCFVDVPCFDQLPPSENFTCGICPSGLIGDGVKCYDEDECSRPEEEGGSPCNHDCVNTFGSFRCECFEGGYELQANERICLDIDECEESIDNCDDNALCENTLSSFSCLCIAGYEGDGENCTNAEGSYTCTCDLGWQGNGTTCENINECDDFNNCHERASCEDTPGSYICLCEDGFLQDTMFSCKDIDECQLGDNDCDESADCFNTQGSFICRCKDGYSGDGRNCTDINECSIPDLPCSPNAVCTNSEGGYMCVCQDGFVGDGISCVDFDECTTGNDDCDSTFAYCTNTEGSFDCVCSRGYEGDGYNCTDINECILGLSDCSQLCNNTTPEENSAGYVCSCFEGFNLTESGVCTAAEHCSSLNCVNGECYSFQGTEYCQCYHGYEKENDTACQDIDECTSIDFPHQCNYRETGERATCTNTEGDYLCDCRSGFQLNPSDNRTCIDINECLDSIDNCPTSSTYCFNLIGSFECKCLPGFERIGEQCSDINECNGTNECSSYAVCINSMGSYSCLCEAGFTGNGRICAEMERVESMVDEASIEYKEKVSFYCVLLLAGFEALTYLILIDINECTMNETICTTNSECSNTFGSYDCKCLDGYSGDGRVSCSDENECDEDPSPCSLFATCDNTDGSFTCRCFSGFDGDGRECTDINECMMGTANCSQDSSCINLNGSYSCICNEGFTGNGFVCNDVNECEEDHDCSVLATCDNTRGSFTCTCKDGYQTIPGAETGRVCEDVDECSLQTDSCDEESQNCINLDPFFTCNCRDGYQGDADLCTDIDECLDRPCKQFSNTRCVNSKGSYTCICNTGYQNISGSCLETIYQNLYGNMTVIKGVLVGGQWFESDNLEAYRSGVLNDMDTLFKDAKLTNYTGISVTDQLYMIDAVFYTFSMEFLPGTTVANVPIVETLRSNLIGPDKDVLPPDSVVDPLSFSVGLSVRNPCSDQTDNCVPNSVCEFAENDPFFTCTCQDGWSGNGLIECQDIDECQVDPNLCGQNEVCVNEPGSWTCECDIENGFLEMNNTCTELRTFEGLLNILKVNGQSVEYEEELSDTGSVEYILLENRVCTLIAVTLEETDFGQDLVDCTVKEFQPGENILSIVYLSFGIESTVTSTELETQFEDVVSLNNYVMDNSINNITLRENGTSFNSLSHIECEEITCNLNGNCTVVDKNTISCECKNGFSGDFCEEFVTTLTTPLSSSPLLTTLQTLTPTPATGTDLLLVIIVSTVGVFILLLLLICLCCWLAAAGKRRRRRRKHSFTSDSSDRSGSIQFAQSAFAALSGPSLTGRRSLRSLSGSSDFPISHFGHTSRGFFDDENQSITSSETSFDREEKLKQMEGFLGRIGDVEKELETLEVDLAGPSGYSTRKPFVADGSEADRRKRRRKPINKPESKKKGGMKTEGDDDEERTVRLPRAKINFSNLTRR
ncbi:Mucin-4 [Holothuria leucospilota]|uniref:Mucin-4 n=1 Tax=Holothuria leucospilota TaxID=206669 RepID=A0A9Q1H7A0_HOLLE|nr:Mucin-4 [Holothuria leucospilota]